MSAGQWSRRLRGGTEHGFATAELAVALPSLVLVVAAGLTAVAAVTAQLACVDAARAGARAAARGEPDAIVRARATAAAPRDSTVTVDRSDGLVAVRVRTSVAGGLLPPLRIDASATAADEATVE